MDDDDISVEDIITLNVSGQKVTTLRRTLVLAEGSVLATMFEGRWEKSMIRDTEGNIFIDQNPVLFVALLNYLRAIRDELPSSPPALPPTFDGEDGTPELRNAFDIMVEFYGLKWWVYRLAPRILTIPAELVSFGRREGEEDGGVTTAQPRWSIHSPHHWTTFDLHQLGHKRKISSFTVKLGSFTHGRIGWRDPTVSYPGEQCKQNMPEPTTNPGKGVGDYTGTVALDLVTGPYESFFVDGNTSISDGFDCPYPSGPFPPSHEQKEIQEGTSIECFAKIPVELQGKIYPGKPLWKVDGQAWESFVTWTWNVDSTPPLNWPIPCISIQGSLEITDVRYEPN